MSLPWRLVGESGGILARNVSRACTLVVVVCSRIGSDLCWRALLSDPSLCEIEGVAVVTFSIF